MGQSNTLCQTFFNPLRRPICGGLLHPLDTTNYSRFSGKCKWEYYTKKSLIKLLKLCISPNAARGSPQRAAQKVNCANYTKNQPLKIGAEIEIKCNRNTDENCISGYNQWCDTDDWGLCCNHKRHTLRKPNACCTDKQ